MDRKEKPETEVFDALARLMSRTDISTAEQCTALDTILMGTRLIRERLRGDEDVVPDEFYEDEDEDEDEDEMDDLVIGTSADDDDEEVPADGA